MTGEMEDFKRPDHPDFATTAELSKQRWSGVRDNSITMERELWVDGSIRMKMDIITIDLFPERWEKEYCEAMGLWNVEFINKGERNGN